MTASTSGPDAAAGLRDRLGRAGLFLWSGWSGLAALALIAAGWQAGHEAYGDFILPAPLAVLRRALAILAAPDNIALALQTGRRAAEGLALSVGIGTLGGVIAGYAPAILRMMRPFLTVLLGVPPIAWIVLAMIWFGNGDGTVRLTVLVAATPVVLAGAAEGIVTRDRGLDMMAQAFGAGPLRRFLTLGLRQLGAHFFPALVLALATAFKVAVMAELLANAGGIGGELAEARSNFDIEGALAWVLIGVSLLIATEYGLVQPVRAELDRWRAAARPWGVKR
ncbi:MAG: ABC transporter permease [Tropicimonas sp.]|uniref:ABC transporter permease n=1 Tax=Tropicimonas sp. TaxID=2067044 RepID=UPI003A8A4462